MLAKPTILGEGSVDYSMLSPYLGSTDQEFNEE